MPEHILSERISRIGAACTYLFVPADRPERFAKAAASAADVVILDLEDAVSPDNKEVARAALQSRFTTRPVVVRVNRIGTPWHAADMAALAQNDFAAVMVPKSEPGDSFEALCAGSTLPVFALVESARGLAGVRAIANMKNVARIAFGSVDFCVDMDCAHNRDSLLAARSELVFASRLARIAAPIDGVTTSTDDAGLVRGDARYACELGFGGKLCIHPRQIEPARQGFAPDEAELAWARKVLQSEGGAVAIDGAMIDEPVRLRARRIMERAG